jgi:hypothetical protein
MTNLTDEPSTGHPEKAEKPDKPKKTRVDVTFNGADRKVDYQPSAGMQVLVDAALDAFRIQDNRHLMALWTVSGVELPITGSAADAGVKPNYVLVLRPSAVRGGWRC